MLKFDITIVISKRVSNGWKYHKIVKDIYWSFRYSWYHQRVQPIEIEASDTTEQMNISCTIHSTTIIITIEISRRVINGWNYHKIVKDIYWSFRDSWYHHRVQPIEIEASDTAEEMDISCSIPSTSIKFTIVISRSINLILRS
jgi:hypothetical protein